MSRVDAHLLNLYVKFVKKKPGRTAHRGQTAVEGGEFGALWIFCLRTESYGKSLQSKKYCRFIVLVVYVPA